VAYPSDLTDEQWLLLEAVLNRPGKRGRRHGPDLRLVVDGMLYVARTGCQWRYLPGSFGPWTRVWSQFRRWARNGVWARVLIELHRTARTNVGRQGRPSMLVIDTHLARGASNGGATFHDKGGPTVARTGRSGSSRWMSPACRSEAWSRATSTHENVATELLLDHLEAAGVTERLELVLVDRGTSAKAAARIGRRLGVEVRRAGWDDKQPVFRPIAHAWRVEVTHGRLGKSRRLAKSFENTTWSGSAWLQLACVALVLRHLTKPRVVPELVLAA
jgi:putative transposase